MTLNDILRGMKSVVPADWNLVYEIKSDVEMYEFRAISPTGCGVEFDIEFERLPAITEEQLSVIYLPQVLAAAVRYMVETDRKKHHADDVG